MKGITPLHVIGFVVAFHSVFAEPQSLTNCTEIVLFKSMTDYSNGSHAMFKVSLQKAKRTYLTGLGVDFGGFKIVKYDEVPNTNKVTSIPVIRTITVQRGDKTFVVTMGEPYCLMESTEADSAQQGHGPNRSPLPGSR